MRLLKQLKLFLNYLFHYFLIAQFHHFQKIDKKNITPNKKINGSISKIIDGIFNIVKIIG